MCLQFPPTKVVLSVSSLFGYACTYRFIFRKTGPFFILTIYRAHLSFFTKTLSALLYSVISHGHIISRDLDMV